MVREQLKYSRRFFWLTLFAIAMAYLEASVVVYLRELYSPGGFTFPLKILPTRIFLTECGREIATILMLIAVGVVAGRNYYSSFAYFLFSFGVWDIFYYVWLKVLLNWPPSLMTWDVLFLIPVVWVGPVLAPIICSFTMIVFAFTILYLQEKNLSFRLKFFEWAAVWMGASVILFTFIWDYSYLIVEGGFLDDFFRLTSNVEFQKAMSQNIPSSFNWFAFGIGEFFILLGIINFFLRTK